MTTLGKDIKIIGITQKGKNRVRQHGNDWTVCAETDKVLFNPEPGPWLYIVPEGKDFYDKAGRWIKKDNDVDFQITNIKS